MPTRCAACVVGEGVQAEAVKQHVVFRAGLCASRAYIVDVRACRGHVVAVNDGRVQIIRACGLELGAQLCRKWYEAAFLKLARPQYPRAHLRQGQGNFGAPHLAGSDGRNRIFHSGVIRGILGDFVESGVAAFQGQDD